MLGPDDSLQDGFAQPLANSEWRIEGEGREVKGEEKVRLGVWDRACYHCRSGRDLGSASQDGEVGGIVLVMRPACWKGNKKKCIGKLTALVSRPKA
jgi:hypothetical protein